MELSPHIRDMLERKPIKVAPAPRAVKIFGSDKSIGIRHVQEEDSTDIEIAVLYGTEGAYWVCTNPLDISNDRDVVEALMVAHDAKASYMLGQINYNEMVARIEENAAR